MREAEHLDAVLMRRAVITSVAAEAKAKPAASQGWSWSRTKADGWTTERWEGAGTSFDILGVIEAEVEAALTPMLDKYGVRWGKDAAGQEKDHALKHTAIRRRRREAAASRG